MTEEFYIGQIFEDMYPKEAADWCNANNAIIAEIDPVTKDVEEEYEEIETITVPDEYDIEGRIVTEGHEEERVVTKTRTVEKTLRRFEIQEMPAPSEEEIKKRRIAELKVQLDDTDYKIVKCSEYQLVGLELPYDIAALHAQRQAIRDEINELEQ